MATRRNTDERVHSLKEELRHRCQKHWTAESPIPTVRALTQEYKVSTRVVSRALQEMEQEGVLYTVPRVGVFVRSNERPSSDCYLFVRGDSWKAQSAGLVEVQLGFEDAIAQLGGASITVTAQQALEFFDNGGFPPLSGVLDISWEWRSQLEAAFAHYESNTNSKKPLHYVRFGDTSAENRAYDLVSFDDVDGGRKATRHLMSGGHTQIAFLGLHPVDESLSAEQAIQLSHDLSNWSARRQLGWQEAMQEAHLETQNLAFHPPSDNYGLDCSQETEMAQNVVQQQMLKLIEHQRITAVVAANDAAALGLTDALRKSGVAPEKWPAMVGFDALPQAANTLMTSLRISWREIGQLAAEILVQRTEGKLIGLPVHRQVPVRLVQRLSSHREWSSRMASKLLESNPREQLLTVP